MKQFKKYIGLLSVCLFLTANLWAQTAPNRTTTTIVADALAQLPAETPKQYNVTLKSLVSTGEEGLTNLIQMMKIPGSKGNDAVEYAISGWTNFVAKDAAKREIAANTYAKALNGSLNNEIEAFLIQQLEMIGSDNQINVLERYIANARLSAPSTQALAAIGTTKANEALLSALTNEAPEKVKINLVNALAYTGYEKAEPAFLTLLQNKPSEQLNGVILTALSRIGTEASMIQLKNAAENVSYSYQKSGATTSYLGLLKRMVPSEPESVQKAAADILAKATLLNKQDLRVAAMELLMSISSSDKTKLLKTALKDDSNVFLTNTLNFYSDTDPKGVNLIFKKLKAKTSPEVNSTLIYWFGNRKIATAVPEISKQLKNRTDKMVQKAAVRSLANIATEDAVKSLLELFKTNDKDLITMAKQEILTMKVDNLSNLLALVYPQSSVEGKLAVLELISARQMTDQYALVYSQIASTDNTIKQKATESLKSVATDKNLADLFNLLEQSNKENVTAVQEAVNAALSYLPTGEQSKLITAQMNKSNKKNLYYNALANVGTAEAMNKIIKDYKTLSGEDKTAAFYALTQWKTFDAVYSLLDISRNSSDKSELSKATDALVSLVANSDKNGEVKALYLSEIMTFAQNNKQKNAILKQLGTSNSYKALIYVAPFMDQSDLKETAAQSAMNIALSNPSFLDENTANILDKVSKTLGNPDAGYQREAIQKYLNENPKGKGFVSIFNGKDLSGWKGLVGNPITRAKMTAKELAEAQKKADEKAKESWVVENGELIFMEKGDNLCTEKQYGDFEMLVDWKLYPGKEPDAGIYLRGTPQVQIWDTARVNVGAQVGSGGLYNNKTNSSKPLSVADQKVGEWNTFRIKMIGDRVTVYLNGELVVNNVILENFWDRNQSIFPMEQIELQAHGSKVAYREIYILEIPRPSPFKLSKQEEKEGFDILFDVTNMHKWTGNTTDYITEDGNIVIYPSNNFKGDTRNLYTKEQYDNFVYRFEFQLTPGANNGLGIRTPMSGDAAYVGMELQILDDDAPIYDKLDIYQYHGSVYGVIPAKRGALKPIGEWNTQEVIANGDNIKVTLNGTVILDGNIREASKNGTLDKKDHPGLLNKGGHIAFLGHGSIVKFRNIRIKKLK